YEAKYGPDIEPGELFPERASFGEVVLLERLRTAVARINPMIPAGTLEDAIRRLTRTESPSLVENNRRFHRMLLDGVPVEYKTVDGRIVYDAARLIDFDEPEANDWLVVNQFTVIENHHNRRADVVVFVNGLPLVVIELKNLGDENATVKGAFQQLQTYKHEIPSLFVFNEVLGISDGLEAHAGTLNAPWERFMPWRTVEGDDIAPTTM